MLGLGGGNRLGAEQTGKTEYGSDGGDAGSSHDKKGGLSPIYARIVRTVGSRKASGPDNGQGPQKKRIGTKFVPIKGENSRADRRGGGPKSEDRYHGRGSKGAYITRADKSRRLGPWEGFEAYQVRVKKKKKWGQGGAKK